MESSQNYAVSNEIFVGFIDEALDDLNLVISKLLSLKDSGYSESTVQSLFRVFHSIKGNAAYFSLFAIKDLSHSIEQVFDGLRAGKMPLDNSVVDLLVAGTTVVIDVFQLYRNEGIQASVAELTAGVEGDIRLFLSTGICGNHSKVANSYTDFVNDLLSLEKTPELLGTLIEKYQLRAGNLSLEKKDAPSIARERSVVGPDKLPIKKSAESKKTMRISEESVDKFLEYVGELVIVEDMYSNLTARAKAGTIERIALVQELRKTTETFSVLSRDLQKSIMEIRKVSIGQLFQRMPKIVNDVAVATGKKIVTVVTGEELRIDKTIIEKLEAPLIHMVRNAADHGIELPEVRREKLKSEEGSISLSAKEVNGVVHIEISDDGAGLNLIALRKKAISLGIIRESDHFDQQKIITTMFQSGVSTAESVSDISGRGVGMDVVKQNLDEAGGEIETETMAERGTTFTLKIPAVATTQIIHGFVVRTDTERFILPLDAVEATISVRGINIESVNGKGHILTFKDEVLSVERLSDIVDQTSRPLDVVSTDTILILHHQMQRRAFVVTAVDGIRQVVKKKLDLPPNSMKSVTGAAIMGDGIVSLVLNMDNLFL